MKKHLTSILLAVFFLVVPNQLVSAAPTYNYPNYDVDITINQDSTFVVREDIEFQFFGEVHGMRRDIKTFNSSCFSQSVLTCGGFDRIEVTGVYDENDKKLSRDSYELYETEDEDSGNKYLRVERTLYPNGQNFNGERIKWSVEYKVYGGIQWIGGVPIFYWNTLPEDLGGTVRSSTVKVRFPDSVNYKSESFQIYNDFLSTPEISAIANVITLSLENLPSSGNLTVSYTFGEDEIIRPAEVAYSILAPDFGNEIFINNILVSDQTKGIIESVPAGETEITFSHVGYETQVLKLNLKPGESRDIDVTLKPEGWMNLILLGNTIFFVIGLCFIPLAIVYVLYRYNRKGKDVDMPKTIIPLFEPPKDTPPYLLGTLKDESVDKEDIVGSIIDLAFRGYIKIKEITKGSEYELTKLEGKSGDRGLNTTEQELMDGLFGSKDTVTTSGLRGKFPMKYMLLTNTIYDEVVEKGFFAKSPRSIRTNYLSCGIVLLIIAIILLCFISIFGTGFTGYIIICSPLLGLAVLGVGLIIAAKFMPAKTALGSKVYADVLGFRMYLNTAERYRLQKLEPKDFERYLSYAIVFKIEKEWAEKFKDIYHETPDWYEGDSNGLWDAYWVSQIARNFSDAAVTSMTPISSSGSSGSGWGGSSGSFGGFSGGGGGGGSSGGF